MCGGRVDVDFAALRQVGVCQPHVVRGRAGSTGSQGFRGATELTGRVLSQISYAGEDF